MDESTEAKIKGKSSSSSSACSSDLHSEKVMGSTDYLIHVQWMKVYFSLLR